LHPEVDEEERWMIVNKWRASVAAQLLTPAPDAAAVTWKRTALRSGQHKYTDVTTERIERAIADDVAFLAAHPTRKSIAVSRRSNSEATGRIFEKDPITLNPKMTAAELAAVVRTLPEAKQRTIEAMDDRLLKERGL
jgi:hypothetical protein